MDPVNEINQISQEMNPAPITPAPEEKAGVGGIIAIIIIVLVLAVGGYYVWQSSGITPTPSIPTENTATLPTEDVTQAEADLQSLDSLASTSAEVKGIEAELLQ
ncbi:MAG: hypothetical protein WC724_02730 [Candidatus Paceibacterota bacterium]|jgi:uncharacterized protein HemX